MKESPSPTRNEREPRKRARLKESASRTKNEREPKNESEPKKESGQRESASRTTNESEPKKESEQQESTSRTKNQRDSEKESGQKETASRTKKENEPNRVGKQDGYGSPQVNASWCLAPLLLCGHRPHPHGYVLVGGCNYGRQTHWFIFSHSPRALGHQVADGAYGRARTDFTALKL